MRRPGLALVAALTALCVCSAAQSVSTQHVRNAVRTGEARQLGRMPGDQLLKLDVVLPLRDPARLQSFLAAIHDPASPEYRHYLTPAEFTARFGVSEADYDAAVNYLAGNGLTVTGGSRDGMDIQVSGTVRSIESAFHITMRTYRHPTEDRTFYGPENEPTTSLPFNLWHVSGLDNFSIPHPLVQNVNDYAAAHHMDANGVVSHATTGSGPSASFLGSDMRAAYYGSGPLDGAGQNLGLVEFLGTNLNDVYTYYANVGQTQSVPISVLSVDGTSIACDYTAAGRFCDDTEQTLDVTQALGMAPNLASLTMYVGSSDTAIMSAMTTHSPLPMTIGCSWGWRPVDPAALDPYFQKMAAQGQSYLTASGDHSTWTAGGSAAPWPADDANVISVGGTDLITASPGGPWSSETAWVDSGGGISPNGILIPAWQQLPSVINSSNGGSTTLRNGPDVSANANFTFYTCADQRPCVANVYGGTSFAAPMWAGFLALANQQAASNGTAPVGFINPTIYTQNINPSIYAADFHDITSGTSGSYSAVGGYDLVTGWGSPTASLIAALVGTAAPPGFSLSASPASLSVQQGNSGTVSIASTPANGFSSDVALDASGAPDGVTLSFAPNPISGGSGSSVATFSVSSSASPGIYTITVTGTGGGITQTATVSLTITAAPVPSFNLSASPSSLSIVQGSSGSSTIASTPVNGFNSDVALSAAGVPTGVGISFSPNPISAGSGASTATFNVDSTTTPGTYAIIITGTGGGVTQTTTVMLTVTAAASPTFSISASPSSIDEVSGTSADLIVSSSASGGFNSDVTLSASGAGGGVIISFSPNPIAAPGSGSSDMHIFVTRNASAGVHTITVTGTGGGQSNSTTVSLTVTR